MHYNLANLLAALAIMAVLSISLAPLAAGTHDALALERAGQQLAQDLFSLRQQAVAENRSYYVYFEWASKSYVIKEANIFSPMRRIYLPPEMEWYGPFNETIEFSNTGEVNQFGTITIHDPQSGRTFKVIIASFSGRIRIERGG
ncbi:MAG: GspH/FimT family protein [Bacillota bacterium]|jgi:type II secretory pathway pseudopilin PulG